MRLNVCGIDRFLRVTIGLVLVGLTLSGKIGVWGWVGLLPLLTGVFKFCPAYAIFGLQTCPLERK